MESRVFLTAVELGLFAAIGKESCTAQELAAAVGADLWALAVLLNALTAQELLVKDGEHFRNVAELAELLVPRATAGNTGFEHAVDIWDAWSGLSRIIRTGMPSESFGRPDASRACAAMDLYSRVHAPALIRLLDCSSVDRLLDLGGGTGVYTLELARRHPRLHAVIFDANKAALQVARKRLAQHNLLDRVRVKHGDFLRDDIGDGYDMVLVSSVICLLGEEDTLLLLQRVCQAVKPGGRVVICDAMLNEGGTSPRASAVFSVHLLVTTQRGQVYTHERVCRWLRSTGFGDIRRVPLGSGYLITARK